ncbi:MAG TPA: hypothetical protein VL424_08845 [Pararobbsia sp.]|nr:hypothetical protein [Pararobbsia sp.]
MNSVLCGGERSTGKVVGAVRDAQPAGAAWLRAGFAINKPPSCNAAMPRASSLFAFMGRRADLNRESPVYGFSTRKL